eukprot:553416_1
MATFWLLLIIIYISCCYTQNIQTFEQSVITADEYCTNESGSSECYDIEYILNTLCIQSNECQFILNNGQKIQKQYNISSTTNPTIITFTSIIDNITIHLQQSFIYISAYTGTINIQNIHFTSPLLEISNENAQFTMNINQCDFYNINNASIINIPPQLDQTEFSQRNTIVFSDSNIYRNSVPYDGLFSIKHNNIFVEFISISIHNNTELDNDIKGIIYWECQKKINDNDEICGSLIIYDQSTITDFENSIFTIDLSIQPNEIYFNIEIVSTTFENINGPIFNFNPLNSMTHYNHRILQENMFINITNSTFNNNGDIHTDGTIFIINSMTVPRIRIYDTTFSDNTAQNGVIFYWYCSRAIKSYPKDVHCGDIILNNNIFNHNQIRPYEPRAYNYAGSLLFLKMDTEFQFDFQIEHCNITNHVGPVIYVKNDNVKSNNEFTVDINIDDNSTLFSNQSVYDNTILSDELFASTLIIERCNFIDNIYFAEGDVPPGSGVSTIISIKGMNYESFKNIEYGGVIVSIKDSHIKGTKGGRPSGNANQNGIILTADYMPRIDIDSSTFVSNTVQNSWNGLFYMKTAEYINIIDSSFDGIGNATPTYGIMKIDNDDIDYRLKIKGSKFINIICGFGSTGGYNLKVSHFSLGCFSKRCKNSKGEVIIEDTIFHNSLFQNSGFAIGSADVTITNTTITNNKMHGSGGGTNVDDLYGFISVVYGNITAYNVTAEYNQIEQKGLLYTQNGGITINDGKLSNNFGMLLSAEIIDITGAVFIGNEMTLGGGSVIRTKFDYGETSRIKIEHSNFINNSVNVDETTYEKCNGVFTSNINCDKFYGGALYVNYGHVEINNCTMSDNRAPNGGFGYFGSRSTVIITNSVNDHNSAGAYGGFIGVGVNASLRMINVNSSYNNAKAGGVIYGSQNNTISLTDCIFTENNALGFGGGVNLYSGEIYCDRCHSAFNSAYKGGFIYLDKSNSYITDSTSVNDIATFSGGVVFISGNGIYFNAKNYHINFATSKYGAFLFCSEETEVVMEYITIKNSQSNVSSIYFNQGTLAIDHSNFMNNIADESAGVLFIGNDTKVIITHSEFENNKANGLGGCIYATDNTDLSIFDSQFIFNSANSGGAIAIRTGNEIEEKEYKAYVNITSTTFEGNYAYDFKDSSGSGGAVFMYRKGSDEAGELYEHNIILMDNNWINNNASQGGAIYIDFSFQLAAAIGTGCYEEVSDLQTISLSKNIFMDNYANKNGGAFLFNCLNVNITDTEFHSCYSINGTGGVGYIKESDVLINECNFTSEEIVESDGQLFHISSIEDEDYNRFVIQNTNIYGFQKGGDYAYSLITVGEASGIEFDTVNFYNNNVSLFYQQKFFCPLVSFYNCNFLSNYGYTIIDMDHFTIQNDVAITQFEDVRFENNDIVFSLVRLKGSEANFNNLIVKNNRNSLLYSTFIQVSNVYMSNSLFTLNIGKYEGILSIDKLSNGEITETNFSDNHVDAIGGAIRSYAMSLTINNCEFYNNSASLFGGHIAQYEGELYIENCSFEYGYTEGNGGAIWRGVYHKKNEMVTEINNTTFAYNHAYFHGGAILHGTMSKNKGTSFSLNNVQFIENIAEHSGAAMYIKNKYKNIDIFEYNVTYINNIAYDLNNDIMSWPSTLNISSNISSFCPKECNGSASIITYDLFGEEWPPHDFHEYIFPPYNSLNDENITYTSVKQLAILFNTSITLKQRVIPTDRSVNNARLDIISQSKYFSKGNGTEIFQYYPAIFRDEIDLVVQGFLSDGTLFDQDRIKFIIDPCEAHMGAYTPADYNGGFSCHWCVPGTFRFAGTTHEDSCLTCRQGARCAGGKDVFIENDRYAYRASATSELFVMECQPGACCQDIECDVWDTTSDNYQCPEGRDPSSPMCASCERGLSTALQTNKCLPCSTQLWYFLIPFIIYGGLIWWWGHANTFDASLSFWEVYIFRILAFFYQVTPSINILLPDNSATTDKLDYLSPIEGLFNFQLPITTLCVFENMTNLDKILLSLSVPIVCIIWLIIFYILNKFGCCEFSRNNCTKGIFGKLVQFGFHFYFIKAFIKFFITVYAAITRISFQLLTCRIFNEGNSSSKKMYYAADVECLQGWHVLPMFGAILAGFCPIFLLGRLYVIRKTKDKNSALWHLLTLGYKKRAWWYEAYRMFCRLFIISFGAIGAIDETYRLVLIRYLCFSFLIIHTWFLPFNKRYKHDLVFDINKIEVICLMLLCVLTMLADYQHERTRQVYAILKNIPALLIPVLILYKFIIHSNFMPKIVKHAIPPKDELMPQKTDDVFFSPLAVQQSNIVSPHHNRYNFSESESQNLNVLNVPKYKNKPPNEKAISIGATEWDKTINNHQLDSDDEWDNEQKQKPKDELLFDGESRNEMVMNTQMEVIIDAFGEGDKKLNFKKWSKLVKETGIYDGHYPGGLIQFWFNMCEELGFVEEYLPSLNNGSYGSYVRKRNVDVEPILFGPRELVETFRNIAYIHAVYSARNTGKSVDYNCHSDTAYQKAFKMLMELYGHAQSILCAGETSFDDVCDAIINCIPFFTDRNLLAIIYDYSSEMGPSRSLQISWHKIRWYTVDECHKEFWTKYDVESDVLYDIHYICKRDEKGYEDYMLNILICNDKKACEDKIKMCNEGKHYIVDRMEMMGKIKKWCLGNCAAYIPNYSFQLKHHAVLILKILQLYKLKPKLCHVIYVGKEVRCGYKEKGDIVAEFNKISGAKTLWKSHKRKHSNMLQELMGGSFPFM